MKFQKLLIAAMSTALLAACGGGGGGSATTVTAPAVSTASYALQTSYKTFVASGYTKSFTISGSCSGSGNVAVSAANAASVFESVNGFSATTTITGSFTNCTPASFAQSGTSYYNTNYVPLGHNTIGVSYGVYLTPPTIPANVKVGDTGSIGTVTNFTDSTKVTPSGTSVKSYVVEADTTNSAIVNLIDKSYNSAGTLTSTEQDRFRITTANTLTPISLDVQFANGSTTHLVWTFN